MYANTKYESIAPEVEHAIAAVVNLVGEDVVSAAEAEYAKEVPDDARLLKLVQTPVACLAVAQFSKGNLVSHEDTGSKVKRDDNETVPWEWMIDRDEREQTERFYRAMDSLYAYLTENWPDWSKGAKYSGCVVSSLDRMEEVFPVERSYYCFYLLLPLILSVQRRKLAGMVGEDRIKEAIREPDTTFAALLREYAVLGALKIAVQRWSVDVFPLAIARRFSPSYQGNRESRVATTEEIDWYLKKLTDQMEEVEKEISTQLRCGLNPYDGFPLIPENDPRKKYFTV